VIEAGDRSQIVTSADPLVISYSPRDGQELWRANCLGGEVTPSPIFAGGLVLAISPTDKLLAIRPDGQGDVTKSHIAWKSEESVPDITSPASDGNLVFTVTSGGVVTCVDLKDGKKQWEYELNLECNASPGLAGGRLYVFSAQGPAVVAEAGRQFKELARLDLGEPVLASPAFVADRIFVRGATNVFCFGPSAGSGAAAK
jgi:outer membrane protein assembly factor BamB